MNKDSNALRMKRISAHHLICMLPELSFVKIVAFYSLTSNTGIPKKQYADYLAIINYTSSWFWKNNNFRAFCTDYATNNLKNLE